MGTDSQHMKCVSELQLDFDNVTVSPTRSYNNHEVNTPDEDGNVPLHVAVIKDDLEMLKDLLKQPNINVDFKTSSGETPLLMSVRKSRSEAFITQLLTAGCDANLSRKDGRSPLLVALRQNSFGIVHQLIKKGANVLDQSNRSLLNFAVMEDNLEKVCMLLYYGANVNVSNAAALLQFAIHHSISRDPAVCNLMALAIDLVEAGTDVNCEIPSAGPLFLSLECDDSKLFKLIWSKVDYEILLNSYESFLCCFIEQMPFSAPEFLECLYLMLNSPKAFDFLEEFFEDSSFEDLLNSFYHLCVEPSDRMTIINICLSLGFKADIDDISCAFKLYHFGEELEAFIYSFNDDEFDSISEDEYYSFYLESPLLEFILALEEVSPTETSDLLWKIRTRFEETFDTFNIFKYFSMPSDEKLRWRDSDDPCVREEYKELISVPEFPSLLELSRNKSYDFVHQTCNITKPYQFHDAVKNLKLPPEVQDILRFKKPIY